MIPERKETDEESPKKGRRPPEDGGRDWSDASTSQEMPRIAEITRREERGIG